MASKKILMVLTSVDKFPDGKPNGWYLPEAAHPYWKFLEAGYEITFVSIKGTANCDPASIEFMKDDAESIKFLNEIKMDTQGKLCDTDVTAFDAIFFVGGFGVMWDFPDDPDVQAAIKTVYALGKPVAAVCHGPICFKNVEIDGVPLVKGKDVTAYTNDEEKYASTYEVVSEPVGPGSCEDVLAALGGNFKDGGVFKPMVCVAGNLFTGQNPFSAGALATAIISALEA